MRRIRLRFLAASLRMRRRTGYSLIEVIMAMAMAAPFLLILTATIAGGLQLQIQADRVVVALALAQAKLSQLANNPNLTETDTQGQLDSGLYRGFQWHLRVTSETINLAEVAETGRLGGRDDEDDGGNADESLNDALPAGVQNVGEEEESWGSSDRAKAIADIPIMRISISIIYPEDAEMPEFHVESVQPAAKTSDTGDTANDY
ncbi:MAG: type II secretion system protein [Leptospiraceae bacterium]|nr:type II secretion system protein [Leptospiraceae bacterium]